MVLPLTAQNSKVVSAFNYLNYFNRDNDRGALEKGMEAIDDAILHERTKDQGRTWYYRGLIYHTMYEDPEYQEKYPHSLDEAARSYEKALTVDDRRFRNRDEAIQNLNTISMLYFQRGVESFTQNNPSQAYQDFKKNIELFNFFNENDIPSAIDIEATTLNAALAASQINKTSEAKELFRNLIDLEYDNPAIFQSLARMQLDEGDEEASLATLRSGIEKYPDNIGLIIDELNIYLANERHEEAIAKLQEAINVDKENAQLYYALGTAYDNIEDKENAEATYKKALELDPTYFDVYNNLGALYYNQAIVINQRINEEGRQLSDRKYKELVDQRDKLYEKALPYFKDGAALDINLEDPAMRSSYIGLLNAKREIYARLGNYDKVSEIRAQIQSLQ